MGVNTESRAHLVKARGKCSNQWLFLISEGGTYLTITETSPFKNVARKKWGTH